jgi:TonB family protein
MLHVLLESSPKRARQRGGAVSSLLGHIALIGLAVAATTPKEKTHAPPDPVVRFVVPRREPAPVHRTPVRQPSALENPAIRQIVAPQIIPAELPPIEPMISRLPTATEYFGPVSPAIGIAPDSVGGRSAIYESHLVEKAAIPHPGNSSPRYPETLRSLRIEGDVVMRFIVDTLGHAEPASLAVLSASHPAFAQAVREALLRSRYFPALIGARPVRQLVEQRFSFAIR